MATGLPTAPEGRPTYVPRRRVDCERRQHRCSAIGNYFGCVIEGCPSLHVHLLAEVGVYIPCADGSGVRSAAPKNGMVGGGGKREQPQWVGFNPVHRLLSTFTLGFGRDNMGWNRGCGSGGGRRPPDGRKRARQIGFSLRKQKMRLRMSVGSAHILCDHSPHVARSYPPLALESRSPTRSVMLTGAVGVPSCGFGCHAGSVRPRMYQTVRRVWWGRPR